MTAPLSTWFSFSARERKVSPKPTKLERKRTGSSLVSCLSSQLCGLPQAPSVGSDLREESQTLNNIDRHGFAAERLRSDPILRARP